uniref:Reverse transcriptase domain-containing protein n=1 Tax=Globodera rostochiensis TaxID=31243 RepID=A0A914IA39_GLORO
MAQINLTQNGGGGVVENEDVLPMQNIGGIGEDVIGADNGIMDLDSSIAYYTPLSSPQSAANSTPIPIMQCSQEERPNSRQVVETGLETGGDRAPTAPDCTTNPQNGPAGQEGTPATAPARRVLRSWSENDKICLVVTRKSCLNSCVCSWKKFHVDHWIPLWTEESVDSLRTNLTLCSQYSNLLNRTTISYDIDNWSYRMNASNLRCGLSLRPEQSPVSQEAEPANPQDGVSEAVEEPVIPSIPGAVEEARPIQVELENGTKGNEKKSKYDEFRLIFVHVFNVISREKSAKRKALLIPSRISDEEWKWCDRLFRRYFKSRRGNTTLLRVNQVLYAIGKALEKREAARRRGHMESRQQWYRDQRREISRLRCHIGWITDELNRRKKGEAPTRVQKRNFHAIRHRYAENGKAIRTQHQLERRCESLKGQLALAIDRVRLRQTDEDRKRIRFAPVKRIIEGKPMPSVLDSVECVRSYWQKIVGEPKGFIKTANMQEWQNKLPQIPGQNLTESTHESEYEEWLKVVAKVRPRKAPGPDGIPNLLWKKITPANRWLFEWVMQIREKRCRFPKWLTKGRIVLLPKKPNAQEPGDLRPIACLNTCYKLMTGLMTRWLSRHLNTNGLLPVTQRALVAGEWGCTHSQVLDRTITADARSHGRQLAIAWLDYSKAFDSVPHSYIHHILKVLNVDERLRTAISDLMAGWEVIYELRTKEGTKSSVPLKVQRGVLQGDTLSPLLFCTALIPLTSTIDVKVPKYVTSTLSVGGNTDRAMKMNNIFYMDDCKLFCPNRKDLDEAITLVKEESLAIGLALNASKCAIAQSGPEARVAAGILDIPVIGTGETYKYLGVEQLISPNEVVAWERVKTVMLGKLQILLDSDLAVVRQGISMVWCAKCSWMQNCDLQHRHRIDYMLIEIRADLDSNP